MGSVMGLTLALAAPINLGEGIMLYRFLAGLAIGLVIYLIFF